MFGLAGYKYRTQAVVEICSILLFVPELRRLLKTFPKLRQAAGEFRRTGKTELEAAAYLSVMVLESVLMYLPEDGRHEVLAELARLEGNRFRWFRDQIADTYNDTGIPIKKTLNDVLPLTFALGYALWYLGHAVRENRFPEMAYREFLTNVVGMLQGKTAG